MIYRVAVIACLLLISYQISQLELKHVTNNHTVIERTQIIQRVSDAPKVKTEVPPVPKAMTVTPFTGAVQSDDVFHASFLSGYADGSIYAGHTINWNNDTTVSLTVNKTPWNTNAGISLSKRW